LRPQLEGGARLSPLVVAALGGNAIAQAGERGEAAEQRRNLRKAAEALAEIVAKGSKLVVTHGNGPQVGALMIQAERAADEVPAPPLDVLVAETQGWLGYLIAEALDRELVRRELDERCAPMLMRVLVDAKDPAFKDPSKPVGPFYDPKQGAKVGAERGWVMKHVAASSGKPMVRRVVASPRPLKLIDLEAVRAALARGLVPITVGGGGVPVALKDGALVGVEGVIDKDVASGLLAAELGADRFLILTDVEKVASHFGRKDQADIDKVTVSEARQWIAEREFPPGSMRTKVEGAILYLERGGKEALICHLDSTRRALAGKAGSRIVPDKK
jgi:carbamate kinase